MPTAAERARRVAHGTKEFFIGGRHFCCCIPNRFGVILGSFLTVLVAGALSIILWFEVSSTSFDALTHTKTHPFTAEHDMTFTSKDRADFILGAVLETLLFLASVLGYVADSLCTLCASKPQ